jgi:serine/threonine-protein kinase ULK/ATG1
MKKVGKYMLVSQLGQGQFGTVYKATHQETGQVFAVKTVKKNKVNSNNKLRMLFDTEMAVMSKLEHPNLLHLFEYLETANNYYLVLNFCNNGDLEHHVKKNDYLGEQESIYFLMQIMNGFKELHKHKIMHRDFKLANIFLNDDNVIIGDFGFAKSGADMATTKLGSPITMAPELLNATGPVRYTNKADLWSIGVCFYQMIYGKPPWNAKSIADLQNKVRTQSGERLPFPASPPISQHCKTLLKGLMTPDPNRRISWDNFFNHPLFENHMEGQTAPAPQDMRQSVMFRNNEDRVAKLFKNNRKEADPNIVHLEDDPTKIRLDMQRAHRIKEDEHRTERIVESARRRYTHEKKVIVFMMHTCRRLRNLAKQRSTLGNVADGLMYVGLLLLKKGILLNNRAEDTLVRRVNTFGIADWDSFLNTSNAQKILRELNKDTKLYNTLISHLQKKLEEEVGLSNPTAQRIYQLCAGQGSRLESIEPELRTQSKYLIEFEVQKGSQLGAIGAELKTALAHLWLGATSGEAFPFKSDVGVPFDWRHFEADIRTSEKIQTVINNAR